MIDYIGFKLEGEKIPQLKGLEYNWGTYHKAKLGNLTITQMPDGIYCSGSIAKYLNHENTTTLNLDDVIDALLNIENQTGWDLEKAVLMQLEVGCTVPVKEA